MTSLLRVRPEAAAAMLQSMLLAGHALASRLTVLVLLSSRPVLLRGAACNEEDVGEPRKLEGEKSRKSK